MKSTFFLASLYPTQCRENVCQCSGNIIRLRVWLCWILLTSCWMLFSPSGLPSRFSTTRPLLKINALARLQPPLSSMLHRARYKHLSVVLVWRDCARSCAPSQPTWFAVRNSSLRPSFTLNALARLQTPLSSISLSDKFSSLSVLLVWRDCASSCAPSQPIWLPLSGMVAEKILSSFQRFQEITMRVGL